MVATRKARAKESRISTEEATKEKARETRAVGQAALKELATSAGKKDTGPQNAGPE